MVINSDVLGFRSLALGIGRMKIRRFRLAVPKYGERL